MIRNKTARKLLTLWHGGQASAFYAAASSGRVADFGALVAECRTMTDKPMREALLGWLHWQSATCDGKFVQGQFYSLLPWGKP